jgi:serine/threonine-protein kinase
MMGQSLSIQWFLLLVLYGVCIPNTARRASLFVVALAAVPLVLFAVLIDREVEWRMYLRQETLPVLVAWLVLGGAIAIYGSHRIRSIQKEIVASRQLGQYTLKQLLGKGGMGEVWLADHFLLKRPCAIKLIRPEKAGDPRNLARFAREVQAIVKLHHPNVVHVYDYGNAEDGTFYYVMEYLDGMDLEQMVRRYGPLPPERVVYLVEQIAAALKEAHAYGLVHRDIKPGNIIVCHGKGLCDVAKLVDFGIVREQEVEKKPSLTQTGMVLGSPLYMSPEQIRGAALDGRSDLYSLGLVAYYLLTGTNPFRRSSPPAVFAAHLHEPAPQLGTVCPAAAGQLEAAIMRCLEKQPDGRFPDAESFEQALAHCPFVNRWSEQRAEAWWQQHDDDHEGGGTN